jgi:hypothetical protein
LQHGVADRQVVGYLRFLHTQVALSDPYRDRQPS